MERRVGPRPRPRARVLDRVGVDGEIADAELRQDRFHARCVTALGKPHPLGAVPDLALELTDRGAELRAPGRLAQIHERKEAVRRPARDEARDAARLHLPECGRDIAAIALLVLNAGGAEAFGVVLGQRTESGIAPIAGYVPIGERGELLQPLRES